MAIELGSRQHCLDRHSTAGHWEPAGTSWQAWVSKTDKTCAWRVFGTAQARAALRGQHVMVVGDLQARLFFSVRV